MNLPDYLPLICFFFCLFILIETDVTNNFYVATSWSVWRSWICKYFSFSPIFAYSWVSWSWWNKVETKQVQEVWNSPCMRTELLDVGVGRGDGRKNMKEICRVKACMEKEVREKLIILLVQELQSNNEPRKWQVCRWAGAGLSHSTCFTSGAFSCAVMNTRSLLGL